MSVVSQGKKRCSIHSTKFHHIPLLWLNDVFMAKSPVGPVARPEGKVIAPGDLLAPHGGMFASLSDWFVLLMVLGVLVNVVMSCSSK